MKKQIKVAYFPSTATKALVIGSNGKSLDKYCVSCSTEEDLSTGNYILDAAFLIEDNLQDLLQEEVILKVLMDYGEEYFRISKPTVGTRYIDIVARQITIAEELTLWLEDVRPTTMSGANTTDYLVSNAIGIKDIQVVSNISNISTAYYPKMSLYKALYDCDQSFLNIWGGKILRRGYINYINSEIGISRGFTIREGKNLTGFECSSNIDNLVTRAQGKGFDGIVGNYIDSPLIGAYNRVYTDVIEYPDVKVKDENTEGYDTLAEAQAELDRRIHAEYDINGIDKIKAAYVVNFVQLEKTEEYKNYIAAERVYLGDTIGAYVPRLNTDIKVRAMVKKFDILAQKTIEITLSNYIEVKPLSIKQIIERLDEIGTKDDLLQLAKDNATMLIKAGIKNSYVTVRENEIIIGDTQDINTMTKVWRFNNGGLGFSSTGYYGSFDTAITMDGTIVGKFISAISIGASQIKTDELVVGTNIAMGTNARIEWDNVDSQPSIPTQYTDLMALDTINATYIDVNGIWTPSVYAENISTLNASISTAQIETLTVGTNVIMGANATISWDNVTSQPTIPVLPSYIQPTEITQTTITQTTIESPTINGGTINGGTMIGGTIIGGIVTGTVIRQASGATIFAEFTVDANGGILDINDINGNPNVRIGSETGGGDNVGGTIGLYNDSLASKRVGIGIDSSYDAGIINLSDSADDVKVALYADGASGAGIFVLNSVGSVRSYLTEIGGKINYDDIATENWVDNNYGGAIQPNGQYIYLPNGCYLECLTNRLILHANSTNYISVGSGTMIVVEDGASRPL